MKKICLLISFFIIAGAAESQELYRYLITFKNKGNSSYTLSSPQAFLSQKTISRRAQWNIPVDSLDLPVSKFYIDEVLKSGVKYVCQAKWLNTIVVKTTDTTMLASLRNLSFVKSVKFGGLISSKKSVIGLTNLKQPGIINESKLQKSISTYDYGLAYSQINMVAGDILHDQGYKGEGVTIAILDAGFMKADTLPQLKHLFDNGQIKGTWNFCDHSPEVFQLSSGSHGTNVLSIMGSYAPGSIVGVAPMANYLLLRTEDATNEYIVEEYFWAAAAAYADSAGADVLNSSLGYTQFADSSQNHFYKDMNGRTAPSSIAATIASRKGVLVVCSAGNEGAKSWKYIGAPADADSIISVGAVDIDRNRAGFSSVGPTSDFRVKPDVVAMGQGTTVVTTNGSVVNGSGTSFSGPVIAGLAACLVQANPNANNHQIMKALRQSGDQYANPDSLLGYGIPNFNVANLIVQGIKVEKYTENNLINAFPNPLQDKLNVLFFSADSQNISVCICNVDGQTLRDKKCTLRPNGYYCIQFDDVADLKKGIYFVKVTSGSNNYTTKIVKN